MIRGSELYNSSPYKYINASFCVAARLKSVDIISFGLKAIAFISATANNTANAANIHSVPKGNPLSAKLSFIIVFTLIGNAAKSEP